MAKVSQHHQKTRVIAVAALIAGVLGLGIAFAALSTTLLINGTAKIVSSSWDIHWDNLSCNKSGEAIVVSSGTNITTTAHLNDTVNISSEFKTAGDQVICTMDAVNAGTINAKISSLDSSLAALTDIASVPGNTITSTLTYTSGSLAVANNDTLNAGVTKNMTLTLTYTGAQVGTSPSAVTFSYTLPYVQAN